MNGSKNKKVEETVTLVLRQMDHPQIERFRRQVELVNCIGETDLEKLAVTIRELNSHNPGSLYEPEQIKKELFQMSHAGYLGAELAKAETSLRLGMNYEQDKPLRSPGN